MLRNNAVLKNNAHAYKAFENDFYDCIVRYDKQKAVINEIDSLLNKNGIKHIFLRGAKSENIIPCPNSELWET